MCAPARLCACVCVCVCAPLQATRQSLKQYIQAALKERANNPQDRKAAAAALKKAVQFNAIVVTPTLERVSRCCCCCC